MQKGSTERLPIDDYLQDIVQLVDSHRALVVTAAPGAGKTTRVPPALIGSGRVLLLQPRRVAARAIAQRIAGEQGWTVGREIGWHVRFDRRESRDTRLLVATEGILTARLQQDPFLSDFRTIVIDEFHERSIHADLGLSLAKQAWTARDDLRIVVMSATLDASAVATYLGNCRVMDVPGRLFPVDISYRPSSPLEDVVAHEAGAMPGSALVFLPGAREIAHAASAIVPRVPPDVDVLELHGSMDADRQDAALVPSSRRRVILATNIAETTLTVPDVTVVIDAGWQKVARYDASRGIDRLDLERISRDAADQRAGRAGRVSAGRAIRLWDEHLRLAAHRTPDIARVDLATAVLNVIGWGASPRTFDWFEAPRPDRLDAALHLLERLGAIDAEGRLTDVGRIIDRLPLHPRLARMLLAAGGAPQAARAVAFLSEGPRVSGSRAATSCDLWSAVHDDVMPPGAARVARDMRAMLAGVSVRVQDTISEDDFRRAILAGYPDRLARRRAPGRDRLLLASGTGARLGRESGVVHHEFMVAIDVSAGDATGDAVVRMASGVEREWLVPTSSTVEHTFDTEAGLVRARRVSRYDAITLSSTDTAVDADEAAVLMREALLARGPDAATQRLLARCRAAGLDITFDALVEAVAPAVRRIDEARVVEGLPGHLARQLARDAPVDLALPSGRRAALDYRDDGRIVAAVKLQELFGLTDTPRIGVARTPVTFELLAPSGRPVQVTSDLRSFWQSGYQEVRKELRARYPRHPWPEDPWTAQPTHRTVKRP